MAGNEGATSPRRPGMAWPETRGAYYQPSVGVSSPTKDSLLPAWDTQAKQQHYTYIIIFALCGSNTVEMEQCSNNVRLSRNPFLSFTLHPFQG